MLQIFHRPKDREELFNLRHAQLRNVIERVFGVLKRRFRIMRTAPEYPFHTQAKIPASLAAIHNFIRIHDSQDDIFQIARNLERNPTEDTEEATQIPPEYLGRQVSAQERDQAAEKRDRISQQCWDQYQAYLARRSPSTDESD